MIDLIYFKTTTSSKQTVSKRPPRTNKPIGCGFHLVLALSDYANASALSRSLIYFVRLCQRQIYPSCWPSKQSQTDAKTCHPRVRTNERADNEIQSCDW